MKKFGKVLVSCLLVLLPLLGAGSFPRVNATDIPQPQFVRRSTSLTFVENLDIEYVTSNGSSGTFTLTGTLSFPDGEIVTADPVYSGTCIPASGTTASQNMQSCSLTPRVNGVNTTYGHHVSELTFDDSSTTLTLTGSTPSQVVSMKYSYALVQRVFIGFDRPAVGFFDVNYSVNSGRTLSTYRQPYSDSSVYLPNWSSGTASFRAYGTSVVQVDFIEYHYGESSINISPFITWDSNSFKNYTVAYEAPVSDNDSHDLLTSVLNALNGSGGSQSAVNSANQNVNDSVSGLSSQGTQMHTTETNIMNSMDTALQSEHLQTDVVSEIRGNNNLNSSLSWVSHQITRVITGFNDITPMWEFMFILPLILGIGLVIIGRMR